MKRIDQRACGIPVQIGAPVADTAKLDPARDYYVRVTTRARPLGGSLLGLTKTITGQVKFTFVP